MQKPGRLPCFTPLKWTIEAEKTHGFCDFSGGHILSCSTLEEPGGAHRSEVSVRGRRASTEILEVVRDLDRGCSLELGGIQLAGMARHGR